MKSKLIEEVSAILRQVAKAEILSHYREGFTVDGWEKAPGELVTNVDQRTEQRITAELLRLVPGSVVIGEEASAANPSLLTALASPAAWLLDPLDGTRNFAAGRPPFAVMLALLEHGRPSAAWILDPLTDELVLAERGGGAWQGSDRLRSRSEVSYPGEAAGIVSDAFVPETHKHFQAALAQKLREARGTRRCAGAEYPLLARGEIDLILYWRTLPWDHAAGVLIVEESGGTVRQIDGTPFDLTQPRSGLISASSDALMEEVLALARSARPQ